MAFLNRDGLLKKRQMKIVRVDLEDDEYVFVKQMNGTARDKFEQSLSEAVKKKDGTTEYERRIDNFRAKLAVCTLCNEYGELLLSKDDIELLSDNMTAAALDAITTKAQELNKISEKDKEAMVKNSVAVPSGDSTSGSVENSDSATPTNS
jgi:hypothetical protein